MILITTLHLSLMIMECQNATLNVEILKISILGTSGILGVSSRHFPSPLRLDNTEAWVMEVYPSLLCGLMSENDDLYIKLKLGIFSFI